MTKVRPTLNVCLSVCLAAQPLFAAGSPRPQASRFPAEHEAALAKAAEAFVAAGPVDAEALVTPLVPLATDPEDKSDLARFRALLKEAAALREPVAAKPGAPADGPAPEILDAKYKSRVLALALKLSADGAKAAETRRELLRKNPPVGPDGKPAAAVPGAGQPPLTDRDRAAIARMEARGPINDGRAMSSAQRVARSLEQFKADTPGPDASPQSGSASDAREAEVLGAAASAFKGGPNTLTSKAAPAPEKGRLERFRDATTWGSAERAFGEHSKRLMSKAADSETRAAANFAKGEWLDGAGNATLAWFQRLGAADPATVKQVAIAAGVVAAVVAAPIVLTSMAAAGTALGAVAAGSAAGMAGSAATVVGLAAFKTTLVGLGVYGAYGTVKGAGEFAHKPDLVNGAFLALNAVGVATLAKGLRAASGLAAAPAAGATVAAGAGAVATTAPRVAFAGEVAVGGAVEAAAGQTVAKVSTVAIRPAATETGKGLFKDVSADIVQGQLEVPPRSSSTK